jgi:hypothetical protein
MKTSVLFSETMMSIWDGHVDKNSVPIEVRSLASFMKNKASVINPENALEVARTAWRDATWHAAIPKDDEVHNSDEAEVWYYVKFADGSQALIISNYGVGNAVEVIS